LGNRRASAGTVPELWRLGDVHRAVPAGSNYKFRLTTPSGQLVEKSDPFAVRAEIPPRSASVVWDLDYR